jgi:hypothetical protein
MANPCVIYATAHTIPIGTKFTFSTTGKLPDYLVEGLEYYVITAGYTADSFRFALTEEGAAVSTTGNFYGITTIHSVESDPQVGLDWSDDGGHTWSNRYFRSIGVLGKYIQETTWNRLGAARNKRGRIFRIVITEPVKVTLVDVYAEIEALR